MSVTRIDWHHFTGFGNGYTTIQVNLPAATLTAQTLLYGTDGGGAKIAGIKRYRRELSNGTHQEVDFAGDWGAWRPSIFDRVSSVTFAVATGSDQEAWVLARMDFFE
jgi:hypothetical protein